MASAYRQRERGAQSLLLQETASHPAPFSQVRALRLRDAPLLLLALSFAAGVLLRGHWQPPQQMVATCVLLLATAMLAWWRAPRLAWGATAIFWVALGWTARSLEPVSADTSLLQYADGLQRSMSGRIVTVRRLPPRPAPVEAQHGSDVVLDEENAFAARERLDEARYAMDVEAHQIEDVTPDVSRMAQAHGSAQVTLYFSSAAAPVPPPCGAEVALTVRLRPPQRYLDPGVWQYADALALRGISVESSAEAGSLRVLDRSRTTWRCRFSSAQHWSADRLRALSTNASAAHLPRLFRLTEADTAMLSAMLVGDRTALNHSLRTAFERTGSFHLFVVAGVHVTLLLAGLYWLLLSLRLPRWVAALLALTVTTLYAMLTGFGAPVQRALLMSAVYLLAHLLGRGRNPLNALGGAALAILLLQPHALLESSFQMTVLAVVAIAGLAVPFTQRTVLPYLSALQHLRVQRIDPRLQPRLTQFRVALRWLGEELAQRPADTAAEKNLPPLARSRRYYFRLLEALPALLMRGLLIVCELLLITVIAEMVLALPMALYFHRMTPFAAPANLLALPLVGVLMASAIMTFAASLVHPALAALPAAATALVLHLVTAAVGGISSLHGADVRIPGPLLLNIAVALVLWCAAMVLLRLADRRLGWLGAALLPLALLLILWPRRPALHPAALELTAMDVGQGDSVLLASPDGKTMLIDAGGPTGSASMTEVGNFDVGEEVVSPYLWSRGLRRLDVLVLTHAHSDHIGGMAAVLRNFRPGELWVSVDADTPPFRALLAIAHTMGVTVRHLRGGDQPPWGSAHVDVLNPLPTYRQHKVPVNDDSLALRIRYGRASLLAEGDAEKPSEAAILAEQPGPVTLLKVGHHGSNTSTGEALLSAIHPQCAVISCGLGNRFGHPRWQVLERLQAAGVRTARTDHMGAVQYLLHADGSIETHVLASNP